MGFSKESLKTMPITFGTGLACFLAHSNGAKVEILRSSTFPESKMLLLLGGGLIVLASLVRRLYPLGGVVAPKSMQVTLWISPPEVADQFAAPEKR
jgi:hypothetical protein